METIATAAGLLGKVVAKPLGDAALRKEAVLRILKTLRLDPHTPPGDFDSLYALTLIEYCTGRPAPVLAFFRDTHIQEAFRRSFADDDWSRLAREAREALQRNRETGEFGHPDHGFLSHVDGFTTAFQHLVDRSRAPHETRLEQKVDALLEQVSRTRDEEEMHRVRTEPGRAELSPAGRLTGDVRDWFAVVGYEIRRTWREPDGSMALLVDVPQRKPGRFDRTVVLCVDGELAPHHMRLLDRLTEREQAAEGWGLARLRVSAAARRRADDSGDRLFCYSFDELIDMEADFEPYVTWIEEEVRRLGIDTRYIPLSCRKEEIDPATGQAIDTSLYDWRDGGLDDYVAGWLQEPAKHHLSLLGEFGMGKSWFALHLAGEMARGWRDAKRRGVPRPRIPLVIPLRDYAKQTSVQALLSDFFFNKHKINLRSYDVFRVLNRMGRLLLVFDGFDEMAARTDRNTVVANFWELAHAVEPGAKVLLSSRTEHFRDAQEARTLFSGKASASASQAVVPGEGPTFEIIELVRFDDEQIERMLGHVLGRDKVRVVMGHPDVRELMGRPVMSELVIDALPEIEGGAEVDLARIYLYAIQRKMDRDVKAERTFTSRADKLFFLCEVAWEMLSSNRLTLNYRDFPDRLRSCFGAAVESSKDLDFWEQDMRGQGMLVRNAEGDYGPSHKSLLEFLVAYKFAAELGLLDGDFLHMIPGAGDRAGAESTWSGYFAARGADGSLPALGRLVAEPVETLGGTFGALELNETVYQFLAAMAREFGDHRARLLETASATAGRPEAAVAGLAGNCLNLVVAAGGDLAGARLAGVDLGGFEPGFFRPYVSLGNADLRGSGLTRARLRDTDLAGADLTGAALPREDLLRDTRFGEWLMHPSGAVVVQTRGAVLHWPDGDVSARPRTIPLTGTPPDAYQGPCIDLRDTATWWYWDGSGGHVVEAATGRLVGETAAVPGRPFLWQGRIVLADWNLATETLQLYDEDTGEMLAGFSSDFSSELGPDWAHRSAYYLASVWGACIMSVEDSAVRFRVCTGDTGAPWQTRAEMTVPGGAGIRSSRFYGGDSLLVSVDGRFVAAVDSCADQDALLVPEGLAVPGVDAEEVVDFCFRAATGMAVLASEKSLVSWDLAAGATTPTWQVPAPVSGVDSLLASVDGSRLGVLTRMGEFLVHDFRSGEVLSRTMLTTRFNGTRISRDSGLTDAELDAISRAGGAAVG
ncbi:NACHT domain-containing protein [Streptomyces sulfonofaciens]|uniref:NACHT domain-containing protein n=1 Tax=Streptomyces sulfonofaciens TaxID=68272 RepID=UPI001676853C|nr:NACHT domain-containing protein [Streptomyces sulfonofaciens]